MAKYQCGLCSYIYDEEKEGTPWDQLPEIEREKDRIFVRQIPAILARAGYTVEKLQQEAGSS